MPTFAVKTTYRHEHDEARLAARPDHRGWLTRLHEEGTLVNAGPFADEEGALLVFSVADESALRDVLAQDPYPAGSVDAVVLGEWKHLFPFA